MKKVFINLGGLPSKNPYDSTVCFFLLDCVDCAMRMAEIISPLIEARKNDCSSKQQSVNCTLNDENMEYCNMNNRTFCSL